MIKFTCSDCLKRVAVAEEHAGKVIDCPHCKRPVRVPVEGGPVQTYRAPCPACGQVNNLGETDLGVKLSCGACGQGFIFGEEIVRQRRAEEAKKRTELEEAERKRIAADLAERDARRREALAEEERLRSQAAARAAELRRISEERDKVKRRVDQELFDVSKHSAELHRENGTAVLMFAMGFLGFIIGGSWFAFATFNGVKVFRSVRFKDDNAIGAAANALEALIDQLEALSYISVGGIILIVSVGLIACVYGSRVFRATWQTQARTEMLLRQMMQTKREE